MGIFDWFRSEKETGNPTKRPRRSPATVDKTESLQINSALTKGLYHNSYPGMKLAGSLAYNPIAVPVTFMGIPIIKTGDDKLNEYFMSFKSQFKDIHTQSHREGTIWIYPKFSQGELIWEFIPDDIITDIVRDIQTDKIIRLEARESITVSIGNGQTDTIERTRIWTEKTLVTNYSKLIGNKESINVAGIIPVPFSNNADGDEIRGHSDYERIISDLKSYHDIDLAEQNILAKFKPKLVINSVKDVNKWAENNGYDDATDMFTKLDLSTIDIILNQTDETAEFITPDRATDSYRQKLKTIFHKLIEGSGIPEIAWGLKTEGNMASVEENMQILMNYVSEKQEQKIQPYTTLIKASCLLLQKATIIRSVPEIEVTWNSLDGLSAKTKSEIFNNFANAVNKVVNVAAITKEQLYNLWEMQFPNITEESFEQFTDGLSSMAGHVVETNSSLEARMISQGVDI